MSAALTKADANIPDLLKTAESKVNTLLTTQGKCPYRAGVGAPAPARHRATRDRPPPPGAHPGVRHDRHDRRAEDADAGNAPRSHRAVAAPPPGARRVDRPGVPHRGGAVPRVLLLVSDGPPDPHEPPADPAGRPQPAC